MLILKQILQKASKYVTGTLLVIVLGAGLFLYSEYKSFNRDTLGIKVYTEPIVKVETRTVYKDRPVIKETQCLNTKVIIPDKVQEKQLIKDFKFDPTKEVSTNIVDIRKLPSGASGLITVNKETGETGLSLNLNKRRFLRAGEGWSLDLGANPFNYKEDNILLIGKDLLMIGDAPLKISGGYLNNSLHLYVIYHKDFTWK